MNQEVNPEESRKKEYQPPHLVAISLRPEKAVLGHCKIAGAAGSVGGSCTVLFCNSIGS